MNPRDFISDPLPRRKTRAEELVQRVQDNYIACRLGKQPGHEVALYLCSPFGEYRVQTLFAQGESLLVMNIQSDGANPDILHCPVEMAAFRMSHFVPVKGDENYKTLVGFGSTVGQAQGA